LGDVLVFDPVCGAAGDMILGSLLDLGASPDRVREAVEAAANVEIKVKRVKRCGVEACRVEIRELKSDLKGTETEITDRLRDSGLTGRVLEGCLKVFHVLAEAEGRVHGVPRGELRLHEVGQEDAIADVVGVWTAISDLGFPRVYSTLVSVGRGVGYGWGVPAPATLEILRKRRIPWMGGPVEGELLTPTGAALLGCLVEKWGEFPALMTRDVGLGAGSRELPIPNVLRVVRGEPVEGLVADRIAVLETNVDDVEGRVLGNLIETLLEEGAKDVSVIPATMKKSRSGHLIQVIVKPEDTHRLARRLMEETGTLGVRVMPVGHRLTLTRETKTIEVEIKRMKDKVRVKIARDTHGNVVNVSPEFEDCKKLARKTRAPLREVLKRAEEEGARIYS